MRRRSEGAIRLVRDRFHYRETIRPLLRFLQQPVVPMPRAVAARRVGSERLHSHQLKVREQSLLGAGMLETSGRVCGSADSRLYGQPGRLTARTGRGTAEPGRPYRMQLDTQQHALTLAEARYQEILASHSWRVTAPLRGLSRVLRSVVSVWRRPPSHAAFLARGLAGSQHDPAAACGKPGVRRPKPAVPDPDSQISAVDGADTQPHPARRRSGRHIAMVTRKGPVSLRSRRGGQDRTHRLGTIPLMPMPCCW